MPMVGLIDPSHDERKMDEPGRKPRWLTVDDLLGLALTEGPKWSPWSYELIAAVMATHQERDYLSTSMMTGGCMRSTIIERCDDYIDDLDNRYAALMGTLAHRTLELSARPGTLAEWRFWMDIDGVEFSCSPDIVDPALGVLSDYKKTENPPQYYPWKSHKAQVNLNRYVVNHATRWEPGEFGSLEDMPMHPSTIEFRKLSLVYLAPKGPVTMLVEETRDVKTPNGKDVRRKVPDVWSDDAVRKYLYPRVEAVQLALEAYPEWPDGLEEYPGWGGAPTWACPGKPLCHFPNCLAKRWPHALVW